MQSWNAGDYVRNASFVPAFGEALLGLVTREPPGRVLDLGCGDGALTVQLVERGYEVVAVDASASMVDAARARGLDAHVVDGHALTQRDFDVVFSNAALHWMTRPDEVIAGIHRALRPGGELVAELGGAGNVATVVDAMVSELAARGITAPQPWYFPSVGEYASKLEHAGFRVEFAAHFDRPTPLPEDVLDWIATFGERFTNALPSAERAAFLRDVRARLSPLRQGEQWILDYVRLRVRARKR
ncbi:MAG TPA: methyltransferase domain-containing protein [Polyangiales bacterium]|nr:methyltransferase domain-containing protein [Polyangiales bacterium]